MPKAFSDSQRQALRERLIAAGRSAINRWGMRLVIDDIARDAGISKGSFYSFFPSKEEFVLSVLESWEEELRGRLLSDLVEGGAPAVERWEAFFRGTFALLDREPGLARMAGADVQRLIENLPPERLAAHQEADRKVIEAAVGRLVARGDLATGDAATLEGVLASIFAMSLFRENYPPGAWETTVAFVSQSLAARYSHGR